MSTCPRWCGMVVPDRDGNDTVVLCDKCHEQQRKDDEMLEELERNDTSTWGDTQTARYIFKADGSVESNDDVRIRREDTDIDDWLDCDLPWD